MEMIEYTCNLWNWCGLQQHSSAMNTSIWRWSLLQSSVLRIAAACTSTVMFTDTVPGLGPIQTAGQMATLKIFAGNHPLMYQHQQSQIQGHWLLIKKLWKGSACSLPVCWKICAQNGSRPVVPRAFLCYEVSMPNTFMAYRSKIIVIELAFLNDKHCLFELWSCKCVKYGLVLSTISAL